MEKTLTLNWSWTNRSEVNFPAQRLCNTLTLYKKLNFSNISFSTGKMGSITFYSGFKGSKVFNYISIKCLFNLSLTILHFNSFEFYYKNNTTLYIPNSSVIFLRWFLNFNHTGSNGVNILKVLDTSPKSRINASVYPRGSTDRANEPEYA